MKKHFKHNIYFITGNKNKYKEITAYIPDLKMLNLSGLQEIQSMDLNEVIQEKINVAVKIFGKEHFLLVEDTGLYLSALNGFPGPLIKFLLKSVKNEGIFNICNKYYNIHAYAITAFGLFDPKKNKIIVYIGKTDGVITKPKGSFGFGWDMIFQPKGSRKTFAEMKTIHEKNLFSMRNKALKKVIKALKERKAILC
jgi:non-canonical purine NTP pyrophosphatase (RdgB/HAM1 family)